LGAAAQGLVRGARAKLNGASMGATMRECSEWLPPVRSLASIRALGGHHPSLG
jgi:hypothetical protein